MACKDAVCGKSSARVSRGRREWRELILLGAVTFTFKVTRYGTRHPQDQLLPIGVRRGKRLRMGTVAALRRSARQNAIAAGSRQRNSQGLCASCRRTKLDLARHGDGALAPRGGVALRVCA